MNLVIGICGSKRVGKDTLANFVIQKNSNFKVIHFADSLKELCADIFDIPIDYFINDKLKDNKLTIPINMDSYLSIMIEHTGINIVPRSKVAISYRQILQFFGTEYVRHVCDDFWLKSVKSRIDLIDSENKLVIIPDLRFLNEFDFIKSFDKNVVIRLTREDVVVDTGHASESESLEIKEDILIESENNDFSKINELSDSISSLNGLFSC